MLELEEQGGYSKLIRETFPDLTDHIHPDCTNGRLAVIYDKNPMESSGLVLLISLLFFYYFCVRVSHTVYV